MSTRPRTRACDRLGVIALAAGELRRVLARRMLRVLALLAVAAIAVAGVLTFLNTEHLSDADMAARRQAAGARVAACLAGGEIPETIRGREGPPPDVARTENFCRFVVGQVDDPRFKLTSLKGILRGPPPRWWWWPGSSEPP